MCLESSENLRKNSGLSSEQSGKKKGKTQGSPVLGPLSVLQGNLLEPSTVFTLRNFTSLAREKVCSLGKDFNPNVIFDMRFLTDK